MNVLSSLPMIVAFLHIYVFKSPVGNENENGNILCNVLIFGFVVLLLLMLLMGAIYASLNFFHAAIKVVRLVEKPKSMHIVF